MMSVTICIILSELLVSTLAGAEYSSSLATICTAELVIQYSAMFILKSYSR